MIIRSECTFPLAGVDPFPFLGQGRLLHLYPERQTLPTSFCLELSGFTRILIWVIFSVLGERLHELEYIRSGSLDYKSYHLSVRATDL
jgi:hypothetical protein